jgi:two-component system nitrate/nitrite response regulator NarL
MNNASVTQLASDDSPSSTSDMSKRLPNPVEVISEIKQIGTSAPVDVVNNHEINHMEVAGIDRLIRKGINRRNPGTARFGK